MENITALIDIMQSQIKLYTDMVSILTEEKQAAIKWDSARTNELAKVKDTLSYKEKFLSEAFVSCIRKIEKDSGMDGLRVETIAQELAGDYSQQLMDLRNELMGLTKEVTSLNTALKILFKSNMTLINGLFTRLGIGGRTTYSMNKAYKTVRTSTICQTG